MRSIAAIFARLFPFPPEGVPNPDRNLWEVTPLV